MPIEFNCENCSRTLRVPEGSSGKKSQCPACGTTQEIPFLVSLDSDPVAEPLAGGPSDSSEQSGPEKEARIKIPCPKCQHLLVCSSKLVGSRGQCRKCNSIFTITTAPEKAAVESTQWIFNCPACNQLFEGREEMRGRKGKCHACQAVFAIELKKAESKPVTKTHAPSPEPQDLRRTVRLQEKPKPDQPTRQTQESKKTSVGSTPTKPLPPIRFECQHCSGIMEVPGASAGLETECPYCQSVQIIPSRSTPTALSATMHAPATSSGPLVSPALGPSPTPQGGTFEDLFATTPSFGPARPSTGGVSHDPLAAFGDPSALDPLGASGFGTVTTGADQWSAPVAARSYRGLSFSNVFRKAFAGLFPSCLLTIGHSLVIMGCYMLGAMLIGIVLAILGANKVGRETALPVIYTCIGIFIMCMLPLAAWFYGSVSHLALRAIRRKPFDFVQSFSPGGSFGTAMLFVLGGLALNVFSMAPSLYESFSPGTLGLVVAIWPLLLLPVIVLFYFLFSLAVFAAMDGDDSGSAFSTSIRLVTRNIGLMLGVKIVVWIMTCVLLIPTLGLAMVLPIYFNAALYDMASKDD